MHEVFDLLCDKFYLYDIQMKSYCLYRFLIISHNCCFQWWNLWYLPEQVDKEKETNGIWKHVLSSCWNWTRRKARVKAFTISVLLKEIEQVVGVKLPLSPLRLGLIYESRVTFYEFQFWNNQFMSSKLNFTSCIAALQVAIKNLTILKSKFCELKTYLTS